jgi:membrane-bound serine protease (ClpP class)
MVYSYRIRGVHPRRPREVIVAINLGVLVISLAAILIAACQHIPSPSAELAQSDMALAVEVRGNIDGGMVSLIERAIGDAREKGFAVILIVDSYGGYVASADRISEIIISSGARCVAYIPPGGKGVSAASMIAIACGKIYMGPGSSIGDAKPIPSDEKTVNYVASRFRALAERAYGEPEKVKVAERFVRESLTLTDKEAVSMGIALPAGELRNVLTAENLSIVGTYSKSLFEEAISIISDPLIYSLILTIGFYLILAEIFITGFQGYAVAGALLILLALYGMSIVPPDLLSIALLLSGMVLVLVELITPGLGGFGIAGAILLGLGIYMLVAQRPPGTLSIDVIAIAILTSSLAGIIGFIAYKAAQTMRMKRYRSEELVIGKIGIAKTDISETSPGVVYVAGEDWTAYSVSGKIPSGSKVIVVSVEGLILRVKMYEEQIR